MATKTETKDKDNSGILRGIKEGNAATRKLKQLSSNALRVGLVGAEKRIFVAEVDTDVTVEDVLNDAYFTHVAATLRAWDEIELRWRNRSFRVLLVVHSAGAVWAKTHVVSMTHMGTTIKAEEIPEGFAIDFDGAHWRAIRKADHVVMHGGFATDRQALEWLRLQQAA